MSERLNYFDLKVKEDHERIQFVENVLFENIIIARYQLLFKK